MLSQKLENIGCIIHHCKGDADLLIVQTALECAESKNIVAVADDTDILCLLIHHVNETMQCVWLQNTGTNKRENSCWTIRETQVRLGQILCRSILFVHALLGCDTTSRIYGIGKIEH